MLTQLLIKWGHVLDTMNVKSQDLREFMAIYADYYARIESENVRNSNKVDPSDKFVSTLELTLNLLSKLNIEDKNLLLVNHAPNVMYTYTFSKDLTDTAFPKDIINQWIQKEAIQKFANELNEQLKEKKNLRIEQLVQNFKINSVENGAITMTFMGRFSMD